jgi:hypothetical protein
MIILSQGPHPKVPIPAPPSPVHTLRAPRLCMRPDARAWPPVGPIELAVRFSSRSARFSGIAFIPRDDPEKRTVAVLRGERAVRWWGGEGKEINFARASSTNQGAPEKNARSERSGSKQGCFRDPLPPFPRKGFSPTTLSLNDGACRDLGDGDGPGLPNVIKLELERGERPVGFEHARQRRGPRRPDAAPAELESPHRLKGRGGGGGRRAGT